MIDIKKRRENLGYTPEQIAEKVGVSRATIYRWESGDTNDMKWSKILALAEALRIDPVTLVMNIPENEIFDNATDAVKIPVIGSIACGSPILAQENIIGYEYASALTVGKHDCFYLKCDGDSMENTIADGSLVLVRKQEDVENGEIAAVIFLEDNTVTLKRVRKFNNSVLLVADNPNYDPILIKKGIPIKILGKAIQVVNSL